MNLKPGSQNARVLEILQDGQPHTVTEIHARAGTMRLNSRTAELRRWLRAEGKTIACWLARDEAGKLDYCYQVVDLAPLATEAVVRAIESRL